MQPGAWWQGSQGRMATWRLRWDPGWEQRALPVRLAWVALERVEKSGPGSKVSRPEVFLIVQKLKRALDRGEPAV